MTILTHEITGNLWKDLIKTAENVCEVYLHEALETYLIELLMRYIKQTDVVDTVLATQMLEAFSMPDRSHRQGHLLRRVGDECLLFAGLFPEIADRRHVQISYYVDMGKIAYQRISINAGDLFDLLASQFVAIMDVLQSIYPHRMLSPLKAYEQWETLRSKRALAMLEHYRHYKSSKPWKMH